MIYLNNTGTKATHDSEVLIPSWLKFQGSNRNLVQRTSIIYRQYFYFLVKLSMEQCSSAVHRFADLAFTKNAYFLNIL